MRFHRLRAAAEADRAGAAIDSTAAAAVGAGPFLDTPQKAGAGADRTVTRGHDAMGAYSSLRHDRTPGYPPFGYDGGGWFGWMPLTRRRRKLCRHSNCARQRIDETVVLWLSSLVSGLYTLAALWQVLLFFDDTQRDHDARYDSHCREYRRCGRGRSRLCFTA